MEIKIVEQVVFQLVVFEQSTNFSSKLVQEGFFEVFEPAPPIIPIDVPTKAHSKCMMTCKGKKGDEGEWFSCQGDLEVSIS